ncbi:MAG TPA: hypothetical protein VGW34_13330 [Allosphingosinicella sp.]|nr:hypothetical protein [Allosphingosinicella sp.]
MQSVETGTVPTPDSLVLSVHKRTGFTYNAQRRPTREKLIAGGTTWQLIHRLYQARGELVCETVRMNPAAFAALPNPCELGAEGPHGPDRITRHSYDAAGALTGIYEGTGTTAMLALLSYTPQGLTDVRSEGKGSGVDHDYDPIGRLTRQADTS